MKDTSHLQNLSLRKDLLASMVVFLTAVPLCLGIALACGAPLVSGIISGIIGGIVVGFLSQSQLSVSGPAAGMIAVIIAALAQIGSFEGLLLALVLAGALQIIGGLLRAGFVANFVPNTVIQGLLVAIGILIIFKQLPLALGYFVEVQSLDFALKTAQETFSIKSIIEIFSHINEVALMITLISLSILVFWEKLFPKAAKILPAAVIVVLTAVGINQILEAVAADYALHSYNLVNIPLSHSIADFLGQFQHPDFSKWQDVTIYQYGLTIAIVASLETLLNLEAVEKLDPKHQYCSRNKELIAQGVGNMASGFLGGLPITSVIVRSSVNINAGAQTKRSAIFHGFLLLLSLTLLSRGLNYIPIAALAAILIHTGYKLAKPAVFKKMYDEGMQNFLPFVITVIAIVLTDLLLGIVIGLTISIFFILRRNSQYCFTRVEEIHPSGEVLRLMLPVQVSFLNKAAIIEELNHLPSHSKVIIDATYTDYIDNDILDIIKSFNHLQAPNKRILVNLEGFKKRYAIQNKTSFINVTTYDVQSKVTPRMILSLMQEGNQRFIKNTPIHKNYKQKITATSHSQFPFAVVLSCIDSRVPVEIIFDLSVGDLFVARIAGNVINPDIFASMEFACEIAKAKAILVLGHTECGAIKAACDEVHVPGYLPGLLEKIQPAITMETATEANRSSSNKDFVLNVTRNNIELVRKHIYQESAILRKLIEENHVGLFTALYDVQTGKVDFLDT